VHLGDSPLWYLRLNLPNRTLLGYTIGAERENPAAPGGLDYEERLDALNPESLAARGNVSILRLPVAPPQQWIVPDPAAPKGRLLRTTFDSKRLGGARAFSVYLPAKGDRELKLAFVFDGDYFTQDLAATTVLDNLIHQGRIPPTLVVFLDGQQTRDADLVNNPAYADFMATELRPFILRTYPVSTAAQDTVLAGASFGGLGSAYIALRHPDCFGKVLSMSGAFWPPKGWNYTTPASVVHEQESALIRAFIDAPKLPVRFYLDCGLYEWRMLLSNRSLRDVLQAKGYAVSCTERPGTHNAVHWRNSLGDGLADLLGPDAAVGK
jgi:enterochelin esterase family protein